MEKVRAIILTGVSGSGKSTAIKALEDVGYFCVDNLPVQLLETFLVLCDRNPDVSRVALVMDIRERPFAGGFRGLIEHVRGLGLRADILYLDTAAETLIRRYSETRRTHPLSEATTSIEEAIAQERTLLADLRAEATLVLDTSRMTVHELKLAVQEFARAKDDSNGRMRISVQSFGFKYGVPPEAHYVIDVRFVPNPYFEEQLRPLTGRDLAVQQFLQARPEAEQLLAHLGSFFDFVVPHNEHEGKALLTLSIGCTGGRHRSVYFAEVLGERLRARGYRVNVFHRDVSRG